jgi:hypothetical protein
MPLFIYVQTLEGHQLDLGEGLLTMWDHNVAPFQVFGLVFGMVGNGSISLLNRFLQRIL